MSSPELNDRAKGALYGAFIGDALAMPVHWYHETHKLKADYGEVVDFMKPRNPHTDSFMDSASYTPPNKKGDILHDQAKYWGKKGIHYHQFLEAGENTLNLQLAHRVWTGMHEDGGYDVDRQVNRYIHFFVTPGQHRDTYIEGCHQHFFVEYSQGRHPMHCSKEGEKHIGGLAALAPILVYYHDNAQAAKLAALQHLYVTQLGQQMTQAATFFCESMAELFAGKALNEVMHDQIARNALLKFPFDAMLGLEDEVVVGKNFKTSSNADQAIPCIAYLALKYGDHPEKAMIKNTNLGGDNCHRGAVLGALLGAAHGINAWPERWMSGLKTRLE